MSKRTEHYQVPETRSDERVDKFLATEADELSRTRIQDLMTEGRLRMRRPTEESESWSILRKHAHALRGGEELELEIPPPKRSDTPPAPEPTPLSVVYEDDSLLVVDKPRGMVTHPGPGHANGTLVNALLSYSGRLSEIGGVVRPGIVHRLDRGTSGLLMVAKTDQVHRTLSRQLAKRTVDRGYLALVRGTPSPPSDTIDMPIGRNPNNRKRFAVIEGGKAASTSYRVVRAVGSFSLVELRLETGRTHQIRVHMRSRGHPLVGDDKYGRALRGIATSIPKALRECVDRLNGFALHAYLLGFAHPVSSAYVRSFSPLPGDLRQLIGIIESMDV